MNAEQWELLNGQDEIQDLSAQEMFAASGGFYPWPGTEWPTVTTYGPYGQVIKTPWNPYQPSSRWVPDSYSYGGQLIPGHWVAI